MSSIDYVVQDHIALITLDRPEARNAQNPQLLDELNRAWMAAADDKEVRVIVLNANGPHFSAGHDLTDGTEKFGPSWATADGGVAAGYRWEATHYFGYSRAWRDIPKPSIAAVHGACIAGGLMLCWPCDLIVASEDAYFSDPVIHLGIAGVEYHGHTWEWGPRKAKELLFTGDTLSAGEAHRLGMVNHVVERDDLVGFTLELAEKIARMSPFALAQAKRAVNLTMDVAGQQTAMQAVFDTHWLGHANALVVNGNASPLLTDLEGMKAANRGS